MRYCFWWAKDGSAPPSVNASRVDLSTACDKGSAIYLGCSPPRPSPSFSGTPVPPSTGAINKMPSTSSSTISLSGRSKKSQRNTPPVIGIDALHCIVEPKKKLLNNGHTETQSMHFIFLQIGKPKEIAQIMQNHHNDGCNINAISTNRY